MTGLPFSRYLSARTAQLPSFSPDGRSICFISDVTGVPQLWQTSLDGGWPDQLTFAADRVMSGRYAHESDLIVYGFDSGGNEREQLFTLSGYDSTELAVDPAVMHTFGAIAWDDRRVAFSDNRRHPAYFDVYVRDIDGSNERCAYQQDGSNFVSDWSRDGRFMIVFRMNGSMDSDLFLLDLETEEARQLTPHEEITVYNGAQFTPDGKSIYLRTDQGSEFLRLARMSLDTREIEFLTPDDADIETAILSPDGTWIAMIRNEQGYSRLVARSLETGEVRSPAGLPAGVAMQLDWSQDGRRLAFTFSSSAQNPNIWLWDLEDDTCRQITFVTGGGIPRESLVEPELVRFSSFDGLEVPAFLYVPASPGLSRGEGGGCCPSCAERKRVGRLALMRPAPGRGQAPGAPSRRGSPRGRGSRPCGRPRR